MEVRDAILDAIRPPPPDRGGPDLVHGPEDIIRSYHQDMSDLKHWNISSEDKARILENYRACIAHIRRVNGL